MTLSTERCIDERYWGKRPDRDIDWDKEFAKAEQLVKEKECQDTWIDCGSPTSTCCTHTKETEA